MAEVALFHPAAVAEAPGRWPQYFEGSRRYVLRRFPFAVVYREFKGTLQIVAGAHGRRRPDCWRTR